MSCFGKKRKSDGDAVQPSRNRPDRGDGPLIEDSFSDVNSKYDVDNASELGSGQYGIVRRCTDRKTGKVLAVKSILKSHVANLKILREEVMLLKEVSHPNIIDLIDVFEDEENLHLVTGMCTGGELFDRIQARRNSDSPEHESGSFSEREAAVIVKQMLAAIAYCHDEKNIVHRDLKPENFLFETDAPGAAVKVIDFGYATRHVTGKNKPMTAEVGTPLYMAPEVMNKKYDRACDVWSIGVIAYTLLAGYPPFNGKNEKEIYEEVKEGKFRFSSPRWDDISVSAKDFICKVLKKDPKLRISAAEAHKHDWIKEYAPDRRRRMSSRMSMKGRMSFVGRMSQRFSMKNLSQSMRNVNQWNVGQ